MIAKVRYVRFESLTNVTNVCTKSKTPSSTLLDPESRMECSQSSPPPPSGPVRPWLQTQVGALLSSPGWETMTVNTVHHHLQTRFPLKHISKRKTRRAVDEAIRKKTRIHAHKSKQLPPQDDQIHTTNHKLKPPQLRQLSTNKQTIKPTHELEQIYNNKKNPSKAVQQPLALQYMLQDAISSLPNERGSLQEICTVLSKKYKNLVKTFSKPLTDALSCALLGSPHLFCAEKDGEPIWQLREKDSVNLT